MRGALIAGACMLGLAGCKDDPAPAPPPRPVVSEIVSPETSAPRPWTGTIMARVETDLGFPQAGTLAGRSVEIGDLVAAGAEIAYLDPQDFDASLRSAEAGVAVAQAQRKSAADALDRSRQLVARGTDSATRLEAAENTFAGADAALEQARATRDQAADARSNATLVAPRDGVVTRTEVEPGATLEAGAPVLTLAATETREVVADLTEAELGRVRDGEAFEVTLLVAPEVSLEARLARIDPVADAATRTRRIHLALGTAPDAFRLGALVKVRPVAGQDAALTVPASAVIAGTPPALWIVDRDAGIVHRREVTTGAPRGDRVEVTEGLEAGNEVVTRGVHSLKDGAPVGGRVQP